jgi:hypothetical protein
VVLAVGTILRRTLPAIAITLVSFLVLRLSIEGWARFNFLAPLHKTWTPGTRPPTGESSGWISDSGISLPANLHGGPSMLARTCGLTNTSPEQLVASGPCLRTHGILEYAVYQPASRFWTFQAIETSIFIAIAAALLATTIWWANHRLT